MKTFLMLHGVNHNMFGKRDPKQYGTITLDEINGKLQSLAKELGVQVWLHLSGDEVPDSEPIYRRGGTRRISMTLTTTSKEEL